MTLLPHEVDHRPRLVQQSDTFRIPDSDTNRRSQDQEEIKHLVFHDMYFIKALCFMQLKQMSGAVKKVMK